MCACMRVYVHVHMYLYAYMCVCVMMMIVFFTINSGLVPLIEGLGREWRRMDPAPEVDPSLLHV